MTDAKYDEIERTSLLVSLFSRFEKESGNFLNFPQLLGGSGYFEDNTAKDSIEMAFGQLNIPDLFEQFEFVLNVAFYLPVKMTSDLRLAPNLYSIKTKYENIIYGMFLILTPYSDINITALSSDLSEVSKDFAGVAMRTGVKTQQSWEDGPSMYQLEDSDPELEEATDLLLQRIYYRLFLERAMAGGTEKVSKTSNLVTVMIQDAVVSFGWYCLDCNKLYSQKKIDQSVSTPICSNCNKELVTAPPVMEIEECSFVYPGSLRGPVKMSGLEDPNSVKEEPYHKPIDVRYLFQASALPLELSLAYFRLDPDLFKNILPLPSKSVFNYRNADDIIVLFTKHREISRDNNEVKLQIVTGISDSRIQGEDFMSDLAMRLVVRDLEEGLKKNYTLEKIFRGSIIKSWRMSKTYNVNQEQIPPELLGWDTLELNEDYK